MALLLHQPARVWSRYIKRLDSNPVQTKIATSVVAALLGDALAQRLGRPARGAAAAEWQYDWPRTARLCAFNGMMGCLGHFYYGALDGRVMQHAPKSARAVVAKVAIDQLIFAPVCAAVFYAYKCAAERRPTELLSELREKFMPTIKAGWTLWPAAHVINFALVPTQHRILYINVVSIAGTFILSRAAAGDFSRPKEPTDGRLHSPRERHTPEVLIDVVKVD